VYAAGEWRSLYEVVDLGDVAAVRTEVWRQVERFDALYGAYPSHLDSHQHVHRSEPVRSTVLEVAAELGVVLRGEGRRVAYCGDFHGQDGRAQRIDGSLTSVALIDIVTRLGPGTTEIACHPGLGDESGSVYSQERDAEVAVLCDPAVRAAIEAAGISLTTFRDLAVVRGQIAAK
jgi:predicted glycoside hydrolase/deacetylase ChbG (UPF0249 family)